MPSGGATGKLIWGRKRGKDVLRRGGLGPTQDSVVASIPGLWTPMLGWAAQHRVAPVSAGRDSSTPLRGPVNNKSYYNKTKVLVVDIHEGRYLWSVSSAFFHICLEPNPHGYRVPPVSCWSFQQFRFVLFKGKKFRHHWKLMRIGARKGKGYRWYKSYNILTPLKQTQQKSLIEL